eukprot:scaffold6369_cov73-Cyclotella_meneghiniana.AAC.2
MRFIVPSKTCAALLGTSLLMALTPSHVFARIVGPSDIRAQVMVDGRPDEGKKDEVEKCTTNEENLSDCPGERGSSEFDACVANVVVNCTRTNISPECAGDCDQKCTASCECDCLYFSWAGLIPYDSCLGNPSRRHNRRRGSNSFTRKRHYYSSQPDDEDDDVSISIRQLQQRNRRLLLLAALILAAITWVKNSNTHTAVFRDSTAVQTDLVQRIGKVKKDSSSSSSSNTNDVSNEQSNTDASSSFYQIKRYPSSHDIQSSKLKLKRDNNQVMIPPTTQSNTTTLTTRNKQQGKWEPCSSKKYELERHDYESGHGDICRIKGGILSTFICPSGCHETLGGAPPYCVQDTTADLNKLVKIPMRNRVSMR